MYLSLTQSALVHLPYAEWSRGFSLQFVYLYSLYVHMVKLYLSVFERLLSVFNVNCMHQGLRVTQFQFSVCMYCTCGRIDNKADLT